MVLPAVRLAGFSIAEIGEKFRKFGVFQAGACTVGSVRGCCAVGQPARGQQYPQIARNAEWKRGCIFPPQLQWVS